MRTYSFGAETVPVALAGGLLVGSVHDGKNHRIMLAKLKNGEIAETRFLAGENDWEGHSALALSDGYIIGGAVEGIATPDGGEGWKAYLARLDKGLNVLWELKLNVKDNGCVYSILPGRDGFFIAGEAGKPGDKGFFIGEISGDGKLLWLKDFGSGEDCVFTALLSSERGVRVVGSVKAENGRWEVRAFEFTDDGEPVGEEVLAEGIALTACIWKNELVLAGYRGENFWVRIGGRDVLLGEGSATSLLPVGEWLLVGGELEGKAVAVKVSRKGEPEVKELWEEGWVEVLSGNTAFGVKGREMVISRFSF